MLPTKQVLLTPTLRKNTKTSSNSLPKEKLRTPTKNLKIHLYYFQTPLKYSQNTSMEFFNGLYPVFSVPEAILTHLYTILSAPLESENAPLES